MVSEVNFVSQQCASPPSPPSNYNHLTANMQPHHVLKTKGFSEKVSFLRSWRYSRHHTAIQNDFQQSSQAHGNICVHGQNTYFQIMKDDKCLNLHENCHPSCSINTRISIWHVIVVYITAFSSIPEKWYWCWLVRELLLQEHTYQHLYSLRARLLENIMQNKVTHITVLFPTIKCLTTNFLHYTYYHFTSHCTSLQQ